MSCVIVDHGLCNLGSARRAFEECGARVVVSEDPADLEQATHIVLPGVGAFSAGMACLRAKGWDTALANVVAAGTPLLGICLGMQMLADRGVEGGETKGLGFIPGDVLRMDPMERERLPHIGWNEVTYPGAHPLFEQIPSGTDFYFVHSFQLVPRDPSVRVAVAPYGGGITAAVSRGRVYGVQFHPEKSSKAGFRLIRNFLAC